MATPRKNPPNDAAATIELLAAQGYAQVGIAKELGVATSTLRRWMDEDEGLREAFDVGRETERRELHALIKRDAAAGKSANANAMFLLKCRHGYREFDSPNTKVDVAVNVAQPVMVVKDFGSDEEWALKVAEQQRKLTQGDQASLPAPQNAPETRSEPIREADPVAAPIIASAGFVDDAPVWRARA